jgi:hypothetical protein
MYTQQMVETDEVVVERTIETTTVRVMAEVEEVVEVGILNQAEEFHEVEEKDVVGGIVEVEGVVEGLVVETPPSRIPTPQQQPQPPQPAPPPSLRRSTRSGVVATNEKIHDNVEQLRRRSDGFEPAAGSDTRDTGSERGGNAPAKGRGKGKKRAADNDDYDDAPAPKKKATRKGKKKD